MPHAVVARLLLAAGLLMLFVEVHPDDARAQLVPALKDSVPVITTHGEATAEVVPDIAILSLGVDTERPKAADAAHETARAAQAIVAGIKAQGIDAKDIKTISVTLVPVYDEVRDPSGKVTKRSLRGYKASNSFSVRLTDVAKAGALAQQLLDKGANRFDAITYDYSRKEEKYDALRAQAIEEALRKANGYVNALNIRLGRVLQITSLPNDQAVPVEMLRAAAAAPQEALAIPIEPGVETLRTEVRVIWELSQ